MQTEDGIELGDNLFNIAVLDLETSDLQGDFGRVLAGSILSLPDNEWHTWRHDRYDGTYEDDEQIALDIRDTLEDHEMVVTWYGKGFDWPFLRTRLAKYGNRHPRPMYHLDALYFFRGYRGLKPRKSDLGTVAELLGLEVKPDVEADTWIQARAGDPEAMDKVMERNKADVRITRDITEYAIKTDLIRNIQTWP